MHRSLKFTTCGVVLAAAAMVTVGCSGAAKAPEADPALYGATAGALGTPLADCSTAAAGTSSHGYTSATKSLVLALDTATTNEIIISATNGEVRVNNYACVTSTGVTLKVADVERLEVVGTSSADVVIIDLLYGAFGTTMTAAGSGAANTAGFKIALAGGTDKVMVRGTASADTIVFGTDGTSEFIDFTGDNKADIIVSATESLGASTAAGVDILSGQGKVPTASANMTATASVAGTAVAAAAMSATLKPLTLFGGLGNDTLRGGDGDDTLDGMEGDDTLIASGTSGVDGDDTFTGGDGTDTADYSTRTTNTYLSIDDRRATVWESVSANSLACSGKPGDDGKYTIAGQIECDNVDITVENLMGGTITDVLIGSTSSNVINGGTGDDYIWGGPGGSCSSTVDVDVLNGGAGDDVFMPLLLGGGTTTDCRDTYNGGAGTDFVLYTWRTAAVTAGANGAATSGLASEFDTIAADVEAIFGGSGADVLTTPVGGGSVFGCAGADSLVGGAGKDKLVGGEGNDLMNGAAGDDLFVEKGTIAATYAGDFSGAVVSSLYVADDTHPPLTFVAALLGCAAGTAGATVPPATNNGDGADKMNGGSGTEDTVDYGSEDITIGGYSFVTATGRTAALTITLCRATETTSTTTTTVCLSGTAAADGESGEGDNVINITRVNGGTLGDTITGADTNDIIYGFGGDDTLVGGAGNDTLIGGATGNGELNTITGGTGDDICLARGDDSVSTNNTPAAYTTCELTN